MLKANVRCVVGEGQRKGQERNVFAGRITTTGGESSGGIKIISIPMLRCVQSGELWGDAIPCKKAVFM